MKLKGITAGFFLIIMFAACSLKGADGLGEYKTDIIFIENPEVQTELLGNTQYTIDSVYTLSMPENISQFFVNKYIVKNNRVYLLDDNYAHTILAFDSNGKFLYKAGDRGRARNEYIDGPEDFFVDQNDRLHVFDYRGQKIVVFDSYGKYSRTINTQEEHPWAIGVKGNGEYLYSFMEDCTGAALAIYDNDNKIQKKLVPFGKIYSFLPGKRCFFQNDNRLCHIPLLSDSVFVFDNDTLQKVVKIDFKGQFIMDVDPDLVTKENKTLELAKFRGVRSIKQYQETDSLIYFQYDYRGRLRSMLVNKSSNKILSGLSFFDGISPFTNFVFGEQ